MGKHLGKRAKPEADESVVEKLADFRYLRFRRGLPQFP